MTRRGPPGVEAGSSEGLFGGGAIALHSGRATPSRQSWEGARATWDPQIPSMHADTITGCHRVASSDITAPSRVTYVSASVHYFGVSITLAFASLSFASLFVYIFASGRTKTPAHHPHHTATENVT